MGEFRPPARDPRQVIVNTPAFQDPDAVVLPAQGMAAAAEGRAIRARGRATEAQIRGDIGRVIFAIGEEVAAGGLEQSTAQTTARNAQDESAMIAGTLTAQDEIDSFLFDIERDQATPPEQFNRRVREGLRQRIGPIEAQMREILPADQFNRFQLNVGNFALGKISALRRGNFQKLSDEIAAQTQQSAQRYQLQINQATTFRESARLATEFAQSVNRLAGTVLTPAQATSAIAGVDKAAQLRIAEIGIDQRFLNVGNNPGRFAEAVRESDQFLSGLGFTEEEKQGLLDRRVAQINRLNKFIDEEDARADERAQERRTANGRVLTSQALDAALLGDTAALTRIADQANIALGNQAIDRGVAQDIFGLLQRVQAARLSASAGGGQNTARRDRTAGRKLGEIYDDPTSVLPSDIIKLIGANESDPDADYISFGQGRALLEELENVKDERHFANRPTYKAQIGRAKARFDAIAGLFRRLGVPTPDTQKLFQDLEIQRQAFREEYDARIRAIAGDRGLANPSVVDERAAEEMNKLFNEYAPVFNAFEGGPVQETLTELLLQLRQAQTQEERELIGRKFRRLRLKELLEQQRGR